MKVSTLLWLAALAGVFASASDEAPKDPLLEILEPADFYDCALSPNGRYVAMYRQQAESRGKWLEPGEPALFATRALLLDLETGAVVLAGPGPDKDGELDFKDRCLESRWTPDGRFMMLTQREAMVVDPATGDPVERYGLHASVRGMKAFRLPASLEEPIVFYRIVWDKGASASFYAYEARKRKTRKLREPGLVNDVVASVAAHQYAPALTLRSAAKGTHDGLTWEVVNGAEVAVYEMDLPLEWETLSMNVSGERLSMDASILGDGELLLERFREDGAAVAELRLFDYRANRFVGASVSVPREGLDLIASALTRGSIDRMRAGSGWLDFAEVANPDLMWLVGQLRGAYPMASVRIRSASADGSRILARVSSLNRPTGFFLFDAQSRRLSKVMEGRTDWAGRAMAEGRFIEYASEEERGGRGVLSFTPALEGAATAETVVRLLQEPPYDYDWGFSSPQRYLSAKGVNTLQVMIPWGLQLALARAASPEEMAAAQERCRRFLRSALEAAVAEGALGGDGAGAVHFSFRGGSAGFLPALPRVEELTYGKMFLVNPRLMSGFPGISFPRLLALEWHPVKRYVDSSSWLSLMGDIKPEVEAPVVALWRESDLSFWTLENGVEEQIESARLYCEAVGMPFELDRWQEGSWRVLESWKMAAALTVGLADQLLGTETQVFNVKR